MLTIHEFGKENKDIAEDLEKWLEEHGYPEIAGIYGCSLGGAVVLRFLADDRIIAKYAVIDGGGYILCEGSFPRNTFPKI